MFVQAKKCLLERINYEEHSQLVSNKGAPRIECSRSASIRVVAMGAQEKSQANTNSMQASFSVRVKVYRLNDEGKWDDQGTGHVTVDYLELSLVIDLPITKKPLKRSEELGLFVYDEDDNETILLHRISSDDIYRKQEDTIISWRDPEYATELALSFQDPSGEPFHGVNSEPRELPAVELSTLPLILKTVVDSGFADQLRLSELISSDQEFFRKLMEVFRMCEDLENIDGLHMIFKIVKGIVLLNSPLIFERIFSDDFIVDIIGALEYDPELPHVQHHRKFLKEHVVFKEAIPIKDPIVLSKIHQTYRVGFLKDVVLARLLDEGVGANLNAIIHSNNAYVVSLLKDDSTFIQELFARLKSPTTSQESKKNLVSHVEDIVEFAFLCLYLEESYSPCKPHHLPIQVLEEALMKERWFTDRVQSKVVGTSVTKAELGQLDWDLMNEGIFDVVTDVLQNQDKKLVLTGTDILILFLNQDPNLLRSYFVRQEGFALLGLLDKTHTASLVKGMLTDFGDNMHCQFLEILRNLLDSCTLSGPQRDTIIDIFFERHLGQLIEVITASCPSENTSGESDKSIGPGRSVQCQNETKPEILSNICELLCFCVLHHPYRIKCNFLLNNVFEKILLLTRRAERYLVVGAVRFVRTILSRHIWSVNLQDEHLINYVVRNNVLKPIIDAFVTNGNRYNLLHSAVLDLFEFIRKENLKVLLKYIVDSFWDQLMKFEYLASIHSLKVKYEQCLDNGGIKDAATVVDLRRRNDERALEREEERYFNEDSDDDDVASASVPRNQKGHQQPNLSNGVAASYSQLSPRSLVDYEDDEDDEDYKPPPRKQSETSEEDDGVMESLRLKRKLPSKDKEPELVKKQKLSKNPKSKDNVFAALCSTLSQAVLPSSKKTSINIQTSARTVEGRMGSSENNQGDVQSISRSSSDDSHIALEDNHIEKEAEDSRSFSDCLHAKSENIQLGGEERPLVAPKSSPEMASFETKEIYQQGGKILLMRCIEDVGILGKLNENFCWVLSVNEDEVAAVAWRSSVPLMRLVAFTKGDSSTLATLFLISLPRVSSKLLEYLSSLPKLIGAVQAVSRLAAGIYSGLTYALKETRGASDWKNSAVAGAITGATLALTSGYSSHEHALLFLKFEAIYDKNMTSKKEEKSQAAAERIKAATLSAAKGLSRAQAERAAAAAARNVNAYGQKEEGPSRWQEKREARRQMYLMSTEKAVKLGERKDLKPAMAAAGGAALCQKCFQSGHWTYECKNERVYNSRPSRTQQLKNPKLRLNNSVTYDLDDNVAHKAKTSSTQTKRKHRSDSDSGSDSEDSVFETDSGSGSSSGTGSDYSSESSSGYSSSSDSEEERRRRRRKKKQKRGRRKRYSTSSESSESDSASDSDSDDKSSRKKKRHNRRH
ncbi:unnamed protein product [Sphenostylis stenocarpa]|uniref:Serine/threonine-protein phosphatase 4 regulatory subunit 3-like central domain-containing protein n=1 Tax=Sphenostylis stenocarpa TaxID=92480 RepID=A0AA86VG16_9FABA|nr:unnamed protein product [Sphenostylis stenocarpa]